MVRGLTIKMKNFIIFVLSFISLSFADKPHTGLWVQEHLNEHFHIMVYFHAELGHWQFEYISCLVDIVGKPTKFSVAEKYMSGEYYRLKRNLSSIIICKTDKILINGIDVKMKKRIFYAFRLISDSTAAFGEIKGLNIYELYYFTKKKEE